MHFDFFYLNFPKFKWTKKNNKKYKIGSLYKMWGKNINDNGENDNFIR